MIGTRVLITGGSGFIGGEIVKNLSSRAAEILNLDFKAPVRPNQTSFWYECDVRDRNRLDKAVASFAPHFIFHLASDIDVNLRRIDQYETTIEGTRNMIAAAQRLTDLKRLIHVSTQFVVTPGHLPKSETDLRPYTLYGEAKARSELIVRGSSIVDWLILRPAIIWGPWHPSFSEAIWRYMARGLYLHPVSKRPIMRCYGYVENAAQQIMSLACADRSQMERRVYYIGDHIVDHDLWADGFAVALTGKPAHRTPKSLLLTLGMLGEALQKVGLRAPMDMGRYFRMTTPSELELSPTIEVVGAPAVGMAEGIERTVEWLVQENRHMFHLNRR